MSRSIHTFLLCLAAAFLSTARAQTVTGILDGHITDPAGGAVPRAEVAQATATGAERATSTNQAGHFEMPFLPIGAYDVTASLKGFATAGAKGNEVTLNKTATLNLSLQFSTVQASVTVNEAAQLIDITSGQIGRSIEYAMVSQLPVSGCDFGAIVSIFPGFQTNPSAGQNNHTLSSGSAVSFNGAGTRGTSFGNDDYSENQNRQQVNVETVKELQVLTNSFSAEFGRGLGADHPYRERGDTHQRYANVIFRGQLNRGFSLVYHQPFRFRSVNREWRFGWLYTGGCKFAQV